MGDGAIDGVGEARQEVAPAGPVLLGMGGGKPTVAQRHELASDPSGQFDAAATAALAAWRAPGVLDRVIDAGPGPMPGRVLAGINLLDTATHTWDLATATGQPAALPDDVAIAALEASMATIRPEIRKGRFGPEVAVAHDADPTDRLVAFLGRTP
ncbi:MAG: TIGR03086 family metal-binding protein [Candidatus Limnocylindrales bacterium]